MQSLLLYFFFVTLATLLSVAGLWVVRRIPKMSSGGDDHDIASSLLSVVGTLFSVLLGFMVAASMTAYAEARDQVNLEANFLADVFRLAKGLPELERKTIRQTCRDYCSTVMNEEWPLLDKGEMLPKAWDLYYVLWDEVLAVDPATTREADIHNSMLLSVTSFGENRRKRAVACRFHMSEALWVVVVAGGVIIVLFTYLYHARKTWWHGARRRPLFMDHVRNYEGLGNAGGASTAPTEESQHGGLVVFCRGDACVARLTDPYL